MQTTASAKIRLDALRPMRASVDGYAGAQAGRPTPPWRGNPADDPRRTNPRGCGCRSRRGPREGHRGCAAASEVAPGRHPRRVAAPRRFRSVCSRPRDPAGRIARRGARLRGQMARARSGRPGKSSSRRPAPDVFRAREREMSVPAGDTVFVKLGTRAAVTEHATELVGLASLCQRFASLDDHAAQVALSKRIPRDEVPALRKLLGDAVRAGLLVSQTALVESLTRGAPAERCRITTVAVPTRDRVASLARCLPTYVEDALAHGRALRWLVADDSADPNVGVSCRAVLGDLQARYRIEIAYAGVAEKRGFAEALAGEGLDPEVLEFALFDPERIGYTPGANQNAILLETIGEGFLAVDDDTFGPLRRSPDAVAGLEIAAVAPTCWPLSAASDAGDPLRDTDAVG